MNNELKTKLAKLVKYLIQLRNLWDKVPGT